jgi:hypothetical protein
LQDLPALEVIELVIKTTYELHSIVSAIKEEISRVDPKDANELDGILRRFFDRPGLSPRFGSYNDTISYSVIEFSNVSDFNMLEDTDYAILEATGLIRRVDVNVDININSKQWFLQLGYHHLTSLGLRFAAACKIMEEGEPIVPRRT